MNSVVYTAQMRKEDTLPRGVFIRPGKHGDAAFVDTPKESVQIEPGDTLIYNDDGTISVRMRRDRCDRMPSPNRHVCNWKFPWLVEPVSDHDCYSLDGNHAHNQAFAVGTRQFVGCD